MALKPLPKLIIILAIAGGGAFAFTKFWPKSAPQTASTETQAPAPTVVSPPSPQAQAPAPVTAPVETPQPIQPVAETPKTKNVTSGDAGLNAVLGAGR